MIFTRIVAPDTVIMVKVIGPDSVETRDISDLETMGCTKIGPS